MQASELDVIDPPPRVMTIRGERLEIRPLTLGQLPAMARLAEPIAQSVLGLPGVPAEGDDLLALTAALLKAHGDALPSAVALAVNRPLKWAALLTLDDFSAVAVVVVAVNQDFFLQGITLPAPPKRAGGKGKAGAWSLADSFQFLIERGHRVPDLLGYTIAQFRSYLEAAFRSRARELRDAAVGARAAEKYDTKAFGKYLKDIGHG